MNADGTYPDTPESEDKVTFTGDYGTTISTSDTAIQKAKAKYTLDTDKADSFTLTEAGKTLKIYYKVGAYKITYSYTQPGNVSATIIEQSYNYGQTVIEADKPSVTGYTFVGWVFGGSGAAPETMPAENLTATGTFEPLATTYQVVYHMETLGTGDTKTGVYSLDASRTKTLNSKQGTEITAYLSKGSDITTNEVEGGAIDGFTLAGVIVSYGSATGDSALPAELVTSGSTKGTVQYSSASTLYINYYYTRNVYNLTLEVYRDDRESTENKIYTSTVRAQYGESISSYTGNYKLDSYYTGLAGFTMPEGYKFTSYTDYSTGNEPSTMPAGDVTVIRDVVSDVNIDYTVELYFEKTSIGSYDHVSTLTYSAPAGSVIHVVSEETTDTATDKYLNYNDFKKAVNNSDYYQYISLDGEVLTGTLSSDGDPVVLKVYFERIYTDAVVTYYYGNSSTSWGQTKLASFTLHGKWGSTYTFDPDALYYANTDSDWFESSCYNSLLKSGSSVSYGSTIAGTTDGTALTTDFKTGKYLVSYTCFYRYFDANENVTWTWPNETIYTVGDGSTKAASVLTNSGSGFASQNKSGVGLKDLATCYFDPQGTAYCNINYNQIQENDYYYLKVKVCTNSSAFPNRYSASDKSTSYSDYQNITFEYNGADYPVYIINACAVLNGTRTDGGSGLDDYPASSARSRAYTYSSLTATKTGFTHIDTDWGDDYYYYDGSDNNISIPAGVYIIDPSDRFMPGAYTSYSHNYVRKATLSNGVLTWADDTSKHTYSNEYQQVSDLMAAYKTLHGDSADTDLYDVTNTALYIYNTGWGSGYVGTSSSDYTYTYNHQGSHRLRFSYSGKICESNDHLYSYGYTVSKEAVTCSHITGATPDGYEVVWYMDGAHTTPIPETGIEMTQDRTIYGQLEKSTVKNYEYIYYELADPIEGTINYITKDNIDTLIEAGVSITSSSSTEKVTVALSATQSVEKNATTVTYFYDGAVVMIKRDRPTCTYTELYLSKDTTGYSVYGKTYEEAYGKEGFYYDETNKSNRSYGYVNTKPLNLQVYFARDKYQVTINNNNSKTANAEYKQFSIDQKVELTTPTKAGYSFKEWDWTKEDKTVYTPTYVTGESYFKMPAFNLIADATWTPAEFGQTIMHYFQTSHKSYDTTILTDLKSMTVGDSYSDVSFGSLKGTVTLYKTDDTVTGATLALADGTIYYFTGAKVDEGGAVTLSEADLVAAKTEVRMTSEEELLANTGAISSLTLYAYSYTSYTADSTVARYVATDKYTVVYGMTLEYFYPRSADIKVRLLGMATDGGDTGLTLTGEGQYSFGDSVSLMAALSSGYTFKGWFSPADVFSDYSGYEEGKTLDKYTLNENFGTNLSKGLITAKSESLTYPVEVTDNLDLIALVVPSAVVAPSLSITGTAEYTYGYAQSADNMLLAVASLAGGDADSQQTSVTGYKWYQINAHVDTSGESPVVTADEGASWQALSETSTALPFALGHSAGGYLYKCEVYYKRMDNGRTGMVSTQKGIIVNKANMEVEITEYTGTFDNKAHSITVNVKNPASSASYKAYYNATTAITAENYESQTTVLPTYTHVNHDASNTACTHTTYIYIHDLTGNYNDYTASGKVNITPKTVNVRALPGVFTKMYDGSTAVSGSATDTDSDLYRLTQGKGTYYEFTGFLSDDTQTANYIMGCNAAFDNAHVDSARSFTASDLTVINKTTGAKEYDYIFPASVSLTFSGNITARPLNVEWQNVSEFVYNGTEQAPTVALSATQTYPIPDADKDYIELTVSGKQTNADTDYTATAQASVKTGGTFKSSDYTFDHITKTYSILKRAVTITPVTATYTYDGTAKTVTAYKIYTTGTSTDDPVINDGTKYTTTATSVKSYVNAGTYTDMQFKDLVIKSLAGKVLNDNYEITYATGTMTINKATVTVTGITADEKVYDGTTSATIHVGEGGSTLTFSPLHKQGDTDDVLGLDASKISGVYDSAVAGTTQVNLTIGSDALTGSSAKNYTLDVANSQKTATGKIKPSTIKVKANPVSVVYGEKPSFSASYSGIYKSDGTAGTYSDMSSGLTGSIAYYIKVDGNWVTYTPGSVGVGTYEIKADVSGLSHNDYTFEWEEAATTSILTVTKRPVAIAAATTPNVTKAYDGTVTVAKDTVTKTDDYVFTGVTGNTASGLLAADSAAFDIDRDKFEVSYNDPDTFDASKVTLTELEINNSNYQLVNQAGNAITSLDITASITRLKLTVTVDDKSITYGGDEPSGYVTGDTTAAGKYKLAFSGFLDGEDETAISSATITLDSTYDKTVAANRNAGKYPVTVTGTDFDKTNYDLYVGDSQVTSTGVSVADKLTVTPATFTITMTDKESRYKIGSDGNGNVPGVQDWTYSGFKYTDSETTVLTDAERASLRGYVTTSSSDEEITVTLATIAGEYVIRLTGLPTNNVPSTNSNYKIVVKNGKYTIYKSKLYLTLTSLNEILSIDDKTYDGTTSVAPTSIHYTSEGRSKLIGILSDQTKDLDKTMLPSDATYLKTDATGMEDPILSFDASSGVFSDKNVGQNKAVTIKYSLSGYLANRYELITEGTNASCTAATANIVPASLTIKAADKTISYGAAAPTYTYTATGLVNSETIEDNQGTNDFTGSVAYDCTYTNAAGSVSDAGTYDITPKGVTNSNYTITFTKGTLTVNKATLKTPAPKWDGTNPGTVTWTAVPSIGDVTVAGYVVTLYKDGAIIDAATKGSLASPITDLSVDYASTIRENGGGQYTVKVQAIASSTNNEGNKNVLNSAEGASAKLYATKVVPVFKSGTPGVGSSVTVDTVSGDPITIESHRSYVLIAGESSTVSATMANATGYTGAATASTGITLGAVTYADSVVSVPVSIAVSATPAAETAVTVELTKRPAKLAATMAKSGEDPSFGFTADVAPTITATPTKESTDNIGPEGYDYTVTWTYYNEKTPKVINTISGTGLSVSFPNLENGDHIPSGRYRVFCKIVATRKDNGEKTESTVIYTASNKDYVQVQVKKGVFAPKLAYAAGTASWTFGEARKYPSVTSDQGVGEDLRHYVYQDTDTNWPAIPTTTEGWASLGNDMLTNVGTHYVKVYIEASDNFDSACTNSVSYEVKKNKLATPANLKMEPSDTAPYGKFTWDAVAGPEENNGATGASDMAITVAYKISFWYKAKAEDTETKLVEVTTSDTSQDFTSYVTKAGIYAVRVQAVVANAASTLTQAKLNCADSETAVKEAAISIGTMVTSNLTDNTSYEKTYDGTPIVLSVDYRVDGGAITYQWKKDGQDIAGANESSISLVTYVEDSATYICEISYTVNGDTKVIYSSVAKAKINPRPVTVVSGSSSRVYDGKALTNSEVSVATSTALPETDKLVTGATATRATGTMTTAGSASNTIEGVIIKHGDKEVYKEGNTNNDYTVTLTPGTLTVTARTLTLTAGSESREYNGTALTKATYIFDNVATGDTVTAKTSGTITNVGSADNVIVTTGDDAVKVKNAGGVDVTSSYNIVTNKGTLTVTARSLGTDDTYSSGISVEEIPAKTYSGTAYEPEVTVKDSVSGASVTLTKGTDYTLTWLNNIHATTDTSKAYAVITGKGNYSGKIRKAFVINKRALTLTSATATQTYNGKALTAKTVTPDTATETTGLASTDSFTADVTGTLTDVTLDGLSAVTGIENTFENIKITNSNKTVGDVTADYTITSVYGTLTITKRPVTITADALTSAVEETVKTPTYQVTGTDGDVTLNKIKTDLEPSIATTAVNTAVGDYPITLTLGKTNTNYEVTLTDAYYTVTQAPQTITVSDVTVIYDGEEHEITGATAKETDPADITYSDNKKQTKVGTYEVDLSTVATTNYLAGTATATLTIKKRPITFTAASVYKSPADAKEISSSEYKITSGSLAEGDLIDSITVEGLQKGQGSSDNLISDAVIINGDGDDVTDQYEITYVPGKLQLAYPEVSKPAQTEETATPEPETPAEEPVAPAVTKKYNKLPPVVTPVEPTVEEDKPEEIPTEGKGSLQIIVENKYKNEGTGNTVTTESTDAETGESSVETPVTTLHLDGSLPNIEEATCVLTDAEKEKIDAGASAIIRLTVDDTRTEDKDDAMQTYLADLDASLNGDDATDKVYVALKSYVDLTLEKSIDEEEWERILDSGDAITVTITIPDGLIKEGESLTLVKRDGSGYITLDDLDDDPNTITILTSDFDSEYALVAIMDEETALSYGLDISGTATLVEIESNIDASCFWHWFILLTDIIWLIGLLLTLKRKKEEYEEDATEEEKEDTDEDFKKLKKRSKRERYLAQVTFILLMVLWNYLGWCWIELPASIVSGLLVSIGQWLTYKRKFKENSDK